MWAMIGQPYTDALRYRENVQTVFAIIWGDVNSLGSRVRWVGPKF